jgi:DNA-binding LytR/AlgR family response regulator
MAQKLKSLSVMVALLNQLYPFQTFPDAKQRDVFFAVFLTVFLLVFRPFGLEVYPYSQSYIIAGYGVVTLVTTLTNDYAAHHFFTKKFNERNWRVAHQILWAVWHLLSLGVANFLYAASIDAFPWSIVGFLKVQLYVVLSAIVPITVFILLRQNYLLKRNLAEASQLAKDIPGEATRHVAPIDLKTETPGLNSDAVDIAPKTTNCETIKALVSPENVLTFLGENQNEALTLPPSILLYLVSQDNYVQVVWQEQGQLHKRMLRSTLARYEALLAGYPAFLRCHRAYIVNLAQVRSITGNSQGYLLKLAVTSESVPVSRGKGKELQHILKTLPQRPESA